MTDKPVHERIAEDRAHYVAHPHEDEWEVVPAPEGASSKRPVGAMISVRLSASEADEIRTAAEAAGMAVSAFIRQVVLDHIRGQSFAAWGTTMTEGDFSRGLGHVEFEPGVPVSGGVQSSCLWAA